MSLFKLQVICLHCGELNHYNLWIYLCVFVIVLQDFSFNIWNSFLKWLPTSFFLLSNDNLVDKNFDSVEQLNYMRNYITMTAKFYYERVQYPMSLLILWKFYYAPVYVIHLKFGHQILVWTILENLIISK